MKYGKHRSTKPYSHQPMAAALQQAGVSTDGYLSLRIDKRDLPDNSELVIQVRDKRTGKLTPLLLNDDNPYFGKKSRFYGQTMADGHIFNPYIHRRFVASQFRDLVKRYGLLNLRSEVARIYDWKYALEQVSSECGKLALLQRRDPEAFAERSQFYSLPRVKGILLDYESQAQRQIDKAAALNVKAASFYLPGYGVVRRENVRPLKHRFETFRQSVNICGSYAALKKVVEDVDFLELDCRLALPESFATAYVEAGAYYTLKHAIMFEGLRLDQRDQSESLSYLISAAGRGGQTPCLDMYQRYA